MKSLALILLTTLASTRAQSDPNYCYSTDTIKPQRAMFSTKTAYEVIRGRSINPNVSSECEKGENYFFLIGRLYLIQVVRHPSFGCFKGTERDCRMRIRLANSRTFHL